MGKTFETKVVGVTKTNSDGTNRQDILSWCAKGVVDLVREPSNPFDENAIKVVTREEGEQIGYIERNLAKELTEKMNNGYEVMGRITAITGRRKQYLGCILKLYIPDKAELPKKKVVRKLKKRRPVHEY